MARKRKVHSRLTPSKKKRRQIKNTVADGIRKERPPKRICVTKIKETSVLPPLADSKCVKAHQIQTSTKQRNVKAKADLTGSKIIRKRNPERPKKSPKKLVEDISVIPIINKRKKSKPIKKKIILRNKKSRFCTNDKLNLKIKNYEILAPVEEVKEENMKMKPLATEDFIEFLSLRTYPELPSKYQIFNLHPKYQELWRDYNKREEINPKNTGKVPVIPLGVFQRRYFDFDAKQQSNKSWNEIQRQKQCLEKYELDIKSGRMQAENERLPQSPKEVKSLISPANKACKKSNVEPPYPTFKIPESESESECTTFLRDDASPLRVKVDENSNVIRAKKNLFVAEKPVLTDLDHCYSNKSPCKPWCIGLSNQNLPCSCRRSLLTSDKNLGFENKQNTCSKPKILSIPDALPSPGFYKTRRTAVVKYFK